ncbi:MAG: cytochrome P450 [Gammaproteobacteria bacterium]
MPKLTAKSAQHFVLNEADEAFARDPYDDYKMLRQHAPLCAQPDGSIVVTKYAHVKQALGDASIFSSDKKIDFRPRFGDSPLYEHHTTSIVFNDPPYHTRVRKLLGPFFAARVLRQMETSIRQMVDSLLDKAAETGRLDVINHFATIIPLNLIGDLLGVPYSDREPLKDWATTILGALEPVRTPEQLDAGNTAVLEFKAYLRELIAEKRANPPSADDMDVLWALVQASETGEGLTEVEILHNSIFMLNAGHDTTGSLIANGVDLLLRNPEQRQLLVERPELIKSAIEEMLRMESPLQIGNRRTTVDTRLGAMDIPAGTFLHLIIAAANRDEHEFTNSDSFDVTRSPNKHLAFSHGIHTCAGNSVARIEAAIAFGRLLERFPNFKRASDTVRPHRSRFRVVDALSVDLH